MNNEQIHHMVNRFLSWKLPDNFIPDGGVTFTPSYADEPMRSRHWPIGTNLFSALQAADMIRYMLDGLPNSEEAEALADTAATEHVRQLVIAAREAWEDATDESKLQALDKALEPFSEAVPYANEPERCAVSGKPITADDWHCGNGNLRDQFVIAMLARNPEAYTKGHTEDLDHIAYSAGPLATQRAIALLTDDRHLSVRIEQAELPF